MSFEDRIYACIDLKSFFASAECVARGLDPFKVNLAVTDVSRGRGAICLAISPAMKALGVKNRCRVFEIPPHISYIAAKPRMKLYIDVSAEIYSIYLRYISPDDIHVYSIDECFIDLTDYMKLYGKDARELTRMLMDEVLKETGICATAGIGTNLFLAKVALDVTAKHSPDHMGYLDRAEFDRTVRHHRPITDIWSIGPGTAARLARYGVYDLFGVEQIPESTLYREFGINAELLLDHSRGIETCTMADIHAYRAKSHSISTSQVLFSDYSYSDARLILKEMVDQHCLELVRRELVTNNISLFIGYSKDVHASGGGSRNLGAYTNSRRALMEQFDRLFMATVNTFYPIRKIGIAFCGLADEVYTTVDLFTDVGAIERERSLLRTVIDIKDRYGKNAILKGMNFEERATARDRNKLIGGHNGE